MALADAIERVLFVAPSVHVYMIPPMSSGKGHIAANWTRPPAQEMFVDQASKLSPRLRILERSPVSSSSSTTKSGLTVSLILEDPNSGELFAAAPYTHSNVVMQATDSTRFFAVTVSDQGRKAVLGIGFEERSEAFDFSVAMQQAQKTLGWEAGANAGSSAKAAGSQAKQAPTVKRDWSLKEGETVHVGVPRIRRAKPEGSETDAKPAVPEGSGAFAGLLPPPPSASQTKERRRSVEIADAKKKELADLGFDDGEFGEFQ